MNREIHVRICGGLGVKFPGSTRPTVPVKDEDFLAGVLAAVDVDAISRPHPAVSVAQYVFAR